MSNRNRRPAARPVNRPNDELMELHTDDVVPLDDDEIEPLHDDVPGAKKAMPVQMPTPAAAQAGKANGGSVRRPVAVPETDAGDAQPTAVMPSLTARQGGGPGVASTFSEAFVYVEKGPGAGQLVPVNQGELIVGRSTESTLQINHPSISRRHAVLVRQGEKFFLRDEGSQNGTYVNWNRIRGQQEVFAGDQFSIGGAVLVLRGGAYQAVSSRRQVTGKGGASGKNRWLIGLGVFGAAVGMGVAGVVMLGGKTPQQVNIEPVVARTVTPPAATPEPSAAEVEVPAPAPVAVVAAPQPTGEEVSLVNAEPPKPAKPVRVATADTGRPSANSNELPAAAKKLYTAGDAAGAIAAAEKEGASGAAGRIRDFKKAYDAGLAALAAKDGGGAISNLDRALKLDEGLSDGWGKFNGEVRRKLAELYVLAGKQAANRGDAATAKKAFEAALGFEPVNAEARAGLTHAEGGSAPAPVAAAPAPKPAPVAKAAPAPKPKPAAKPAKAKDSRSAADAAFDD